MGRAPCCEKMGLKKGPWTPDEDLILINYINTHGHTNWRALPKQAGLLRCGKSCRLRWTNYLRPDIRRGNFTREEEDAIIELHQLLGNRWSAIAAKLPGRTDNEIKNVWHTHLKKRLPLPRDQQSHGRKRSPKQKMQPNQQDTKQEPNPVNFPTTHHVIKAETTEERPLSPPQCSSDDMSTLTANSSSDNNEHNSNTSGSCSMITTTTTTTTNHDLSLNNNTVDEDDNLALDEDFWSEVLSADNSCEKSDFPVAIGADQQQFQFPLISPLVTEEGVHLFSSSSSMCDSMDFWGDMFTRELRN